MADGPLHQRPMADSCPLPGKLKEQGAYLPGPGRRRPAPTVLPAGLGWAGTDAALWVASTTLLLSWFLWCERIGVLTSMYFHCDQSHPLCLLGLIVPVKLDQTR